MPTITFILGLCGAGKTWLADRVVATAKFDEGFENDPCQYKNLIASLSADEDAVVVEIAYCRESVREKILQKLSGDVPNVKIRWLCIENDLFRANKNCRERQNKGDPDGHVKINQQLSPDYTYPEGAVVLRMWTKES